MNCFFFQNSHFSTIYTRYIFLAFYLLTWTYFHDVNGGRNIFINSQLKRILFRISDKKKSNKTEKLRKNMEKQNSSNESETLVKMRYQILNSLKPFEFEPKTSSASAVQKQSLADVLQNRCQTWHFIKKRLQHRCFPKIFTKSLRTPFFTEHLYFDGCFWQKAV